MNLALRTKKDGAQVWRLEVYVDGRRVVRTVDAHPTRRDPTGRIEAEAAWRQLREEVRQQVDRHQQPSRQRTGDYLTKWLATERPRLKPTTFASYRQVVTHYLIPHLGLIPLTKLAPATLERTWTAIAQEGVDDPGLEKRRTAAYVRTVLRKALQDAFRLGLLPYNPVDRTKAPPPRPKRPVVPFTREEVEALIAAAPDRWQPLLTLVAWTGLRRGEVTGLQWGDWDEARGTLQVRRSVVVVEGSPVVQDGSTYAATKTRAGLRTMTLPRRAQAALVHQRAWVAEQQTLAGSEWHDEGWIFPTQTGRVLHPRNVARAYEQARDAAHLRHESFHGLRHHAVSVLIGLGISLEIVAKWIGHGSRAVTADTYGHLLPEINQDVARRIDAWDAMHRKGAGEGRTETGQRPSPA